MNFLEALEANKTKRVRYEKYRWFAVNRLREDCQKHDNTASWTLEQFEGVWEAEELSLVVEFEANFAFFPDICHPFAQIRMANFLPNTFEHRQLAHRKRWRIRAEEIK